MCSGSQSWAVMAQGLPSTRPLFVPPGLFAPSNDKPLQVCFRLQAGEWEKLRDHLLGGWGPQGKATHTSQGGGHPSPSLPPKEAGGKGPVFRSGFS